MTIKEIKNVPIMNDPFLGRTVTLTKEQRDFLILRIEKLEAIVKSDRIGQQIYNKWMECEERIRQLEASRKEK